MRDSKLLVKVEWTNLRENPYNKNFRGEHREMRGFDLIGIGTIAGLAGATGCGIFRDTSFSTLTPKGNKVRNGAKTIRNGGGLTAYVGALLIWPLKTPIATGAAAVCLGARHVYRSYTPPLEPQE